MDTNWWPPLLLLGLSLAAYGILFTFHGVTGDDPEFLYTYVRFGPQGYRSYLGWQRPFAFWIYELLTPIFKTQMPLYQAANLLLRWLSAWLLFLNLQRLLPEKREAPLVISILFIIYPGFLQQPIAMAYLQHFTSLPLFLGSILLMQAALDSPLRKRLLGYTVLSLLMMAGMFPIEYFVGWELLRPLVIWLKLPKEENLNQKILKTLKIWLPYFVVFIVYLYWRMVPAASPKYPATMLDAIRSNPLDGIWQLLQRTFHDLWLALVQVLGNLTNITLRGRLGIASLLLGLLVASVLFAILFVQKKMRDVERSFPLYLIGVGILAMLAGGPVIWLADIPMTLEYPWDRTTLVLLLGVCLVWAGALFLLPRIARNILLSLIVCLSVAFHIQNINMYFREWEQVREIFWQLTWRAPVIEPGTIVMMDGLPTFYYPSNSYTSLLNWTYDPQASDGKENYKIIEISQRLGNVLPSLDPDVPIIHGSFNGNTSKSITIFKTSSGCLHVLRPDDLFYRDIAPTLNEAMKLTDVELIDPDPSKPARPPALMYPEPAHGWCYYLQKAELARQEENWEKVADIALEVENQSLTPPVPFDWAVFVEGFAELGDFDLAADYLRRIATQPPGYDAALCAFIERLSMQVDGGNVLLTAEAARSCGFDHLFSE
ncbi:MAG: hypothetical protein FJZ98_03115 [Chloroflexi bacterium]|nr:hypothetical protein [Chloroflexota bacterium]